LSYNDILSMEVSVLTKPLSYLSIFVVCYYVFLLLAGVAEGEHLSALAMVFLLFLSSGALLKKKAAIPIKKKKNSHKQTEEAQWVLLTRMLHVLVAILMLLTLMWLLESGLAPSFALFPS